MKVEKRSTHILPELLSGISSRLSQQIGIFFPIGELHVLEKKLETALPELGFDNLQECADFLLQAALSQPQIEILAKHLTIGETYFFRDKNLFAMLKREILPEIIRRHQNKDRKIRVWSTACATGEEPYSIAILLNELIGGRDKWNIEIVASDINPLFLKKAKAARYKAWSFRSMPEEIISRNFRKEAHGEFVLLPSVASLVRFQSLNLIADPQNAVGPLLMDFDLVLCNNVLIYFSKEQVKKTVGRLVSSMAEEGWLTVSAVEVPYIQDPRLATVSGSQITVFKKTHKKPAPPNLRTPHIDSAPAKAHPEAALVRALAAPPSVENKQEAPAKKPEKHDEMEFYETCLSMYRQGLYLDVSLQLTRALGAFVSGNTQLGSKIRELRLLINSLANQGKLKEALEWCQKALKTDKLEPEIHCLHASVLQELHEDEKAMHALKSALYLNPNMIAAHFSLGLLLLKRGEIPAGKKQLHIALTLLEKIGIKDQVPGMEEVLAGELIATIDRLAKSME